MPAPALENAKCVYVSLIFFVSFFFLPLFVLLKHLKKESSNINLFVYK